MSPLPSSAVGDVVESSVVAVNPKAAHSSHKDLLGGFGTHISLPERPAAMSDMSAMMKSTS